MRPYRILTLSLMLVICFLQLASGFDYQRSRWTVTHLPILCHLNVASMPPNLAVSDVERAAIQAMEAWNRAAGMQIFRYDGRVESKVFLGDDAWNAISFVLTGWEAVIDGLPFTCANAGATCTWAVDHAPGSPPQHGFVKDNFLRAFDIIINAENFNWATGADAGHYDVQSVIAHELGHVLSLGHPEVGASSPDAPTMVGRIFPNDTKMRTLEADDIDGVQFIYHKVSGVLTADARWQNTVWVDGTTIVPRGVRLEINLSVPPTSIFFSPGAKLIVEGELEMISTPSTRPILFTSAKSLSVGAVREPPVQLWGGLEIRSTAQVQEIADCRFEGAGDVPVHSCEFRRNQTAIRVFDGERVSITGGLFYENAVGVEAQSSRDVEIRHNVVNRNDAGVRLVDSTVELHSSSFTENGVGVEVRSDQPVRLRENHITHNQVGVQIVRGGADLGDGFNNLFGNTRWNLALETLPTGPILAAGNYWGELTPAQIDLTIRDDDESPDLPPVQFLPAQSRIGHTEFRVEIVDIKAGDDGEGEALTDSWAQHNMIGMRSMDGRDVREYIVFDDQGREQKLTEVMPQNIWSGGSHYGSTKRYYVDMRAVNLSPREKTGGFSVELHLADDVGRAPFEVRWHWKEALPGVQAGEAIDFSHFYPPENLTIQGRSQMFYFWPRVTFEETGEVRDLPGKWIEIYEDLPDLVGTLHEIPESAMQGEEINVRCSVKNYGLHAEGRQTVRFYLSKELKRRSPPDPDYPLPPAVRRPELEGEWVAKLTIPADVPSGNYYLWMQVDADNDVIECSGANNPAAFLARQIRIGNVEDIEDEEPQAVEADGKLPTILGKLKTELYQNYSNPFNPETWIPYALSEETPVVMTIYDAAGRQVRRLNLGVQPAGRYLSKARAAYWDGRNADGEPVGSGVYFIEFRVQEFQQTRRMVLLK